MTGVKWKASWHPSVKRKSARLSALLSKAGVEDVPELEPLEFLEPEGLPQSDVDATLQGYNKIIQFLHKDQAESAHGEHQSMQIARGNINRIIAKALLDVNDEWRILRQASNKVSELATSDIYWYARGDLLSLDYAQFHSMLCKRPIRDGVHFVAYMRSRTPEMLDNASMHDSQWNKTLLNKFKRLRQQLRSLPNGTYHELHFNVLLQLQVLPGCRRIRGVDMDDLTDVIEKLRRRTDDTLSRRQPVQEWAKKMHYPDYYNCAALKRDLWTIYQRRCTGAHNYRSSAACSHVQNLGTLENLQQQAQKEIRTNVLLASGSRLPAELVELIYEAALGVEVYYAQCQGAGG